MLRIVECITQDHDLGLIAVACLVCVLATYVTTRLLATVRDSKAVLQQPRLIAATAALAAGLWTTHFIGLLAFRPDLPFNFSSPFCLLSMGSSVIAASVALLIGTRENQSKLTLVGGGLVLGCGIMLTHLAGVRSLLLPGLARYEAGPLAAAFVLGCGLAVAAMVFLVRRQVAMACALITLAVASIHFIGMASVTLSLSAGAPLTPLAVSKTVVAIAAAGVGLLIVSVAFVGSLFYQHFSDRIATEARRFHLLADATFEGLIFERGGHIIDTNRAMCALAGVEAAGLIGAPLAAVIKGVTLKSAPGKPAEHEMVLPDGTTRAVEVLWKNGPDPGGHVVAVRDMTREKAVQVQLQRITQFDPLTGLSNRDLFEQLLQKSVAQAQRTKTGLGLFYIDIDRFEAVYEMSGAHVSDAILVQIAHRLVRVVRQTDIVARLGSDEFAVVQAFADRPPDATGLAERLVTEMAQPFEIDGQSIQLTASVGVALYPADGAVGQALIKSAALALRRAKHEGRATWRHFDSNADLLMHDKRVMHKEMRLALEEGQFAVQYQTFFNAETLEVAGCEALLRWNHPTRGRVPPAEFIPFAEENGLIVEIGEWVLTTACAEAALWPQPVTIAVNLSPAQFVHKGLVDSVAEVLRRTGLAPNRLELEITEGTLMHDTQNALGILQSLKALGVEIAMDDFGTGYSSLSYLRKFPFDKIKIDRSFISDVEDDAEAETIVETIIAMGQGLRLSITAEGVETAQQLAMLRANGCTFVQGYLLARPCQASQLDLSAGKPRWLQPGLAPTVASGQPPRLANTTAAGAHSA